MKKLLNTFIAFVLLFMAAAGAQAQGKFDPSWKEKLMSEKVAFLTMELDLTPEEAQALWPVYNKIRKELDIAIHEVMKSHKELSEAVEANKPKKEISALLDKHLQAKSHQDKVEQEAAESYKAVLPVEKVAKLYVAEEKFRRQYIHKLQQRPEPKK